MFFVKRSKLRKVKSLFHGISPQHAMYIWENLKKIAKDNYNSQNIDFC